MTKINKKQKQSKYLYKQEKKKHILTRLNNKTFINAEK